MNSGTGENEQGLRKILDFTRLAGIIILLIHFYYYCYRAFKEWGLTANISDRLLFNLSKTGLFASIVKSKLLAVGLLIISLIGAKGKKNEKISNWSIGIYLAIGFTIFFLSQYLLRINDV